MASLVYDILTDPAPLQASEPGRESRGSVYVVVSNPNLNGEVDWRSIEVRVPFGGKAGDLTSDPEAVKARISQNSATEPGKDPTVEWDGKNGVLTVTAQPNSLFREAGSLVLVLDDFPVSGEPGLVLLQVTERAADGAKVQRNPVALSLLKRLPRVPRNFRPKDTLVAAGGDVVLQWDGPDTLAYTIHGPDGLSEPVPQRTGAGWQWSPTAGKEPRRDATYTLVAASRSPQQEPGYFLTTTVHLRHPEFDSVTATQGLRTPWAEGTTDKGRITFTPRGVQVHDDAHTPGAVTADKVSATAVNTTWVGDHDSGKGWIEFPQSGVDVRRDGSREWGTVAADKADLNGIHTKWVQGRDGSAGWIEFPPAGVNVFEGSGTRQWGTVAAGTADLNDLVTHRAQVKERLTLQGGLTVDSVLETQDGPPRLVVHGRLDAQGEVSAAGGVGVGGDLSVDGDLVVRGDVRPLRNLDVGGLVTAGDLTVRDKLTTDHERFALLVHGESLFLGKVNANRLLSVRTGEAWVMHINEEMVAIQGNLRVHGAFRSDS
ncbi:hypothetical protein ACQ86F_35965 [Streptomyces venezuelae ATCC 10712]